MSPYNKEKEIKEFVDWIQTKDPSLILNSNLEGSSCFRF